MNPFMGKEWENQQMEKLKAKQVARIAELKKQALQEVTVAEVKAAKELAASEEAPKKNENPNLLPPEEA